MSLLFVKNIGKIWFMKYDHKEIESKWQKKWQKDRIYEVDMEKAKKPFYNLMMFPYPSAEGMHVGNMYAFTGADTYGRYMRMKGFDVFEPIGLDGFGIHSENYAIKVGRRPEEHAKISEKNFYNQMSSIGNGFAWEHRLETYDPEYYRWTQWLFIKMFEAGLAYKRLAKVNWCPSCKTVLADEQVEAGECERCKSEVKRKDMSSWHFKITKYADRLLENIDGKNEGREKKIGPVKKGYDIQSNGLRWPKTIKTAQRNWIGRSEGVEVDWEIADGESLKGRKITTFTTRLDTILGVTFLVLAPDHPMVSQLAAGKEVMNYVSKAILKTEQQRKMGEKKKTGVDTGYKVVHPLTGKEIPVWIADFVLLGYGTGAVMGVPAHDERDREFAEEYNLGIIGTLKDEDEVFKELDKKGVSRKKINYHLRDWLISRQRYWGAPIPMVECKKCGWQPVKEKDLPVELPEIEDFKPKGDGSSPLDNAPEEWKTTKCPKCGGVAQRELDVSDTFLDSSWYFLGYPFMKNGKWDGKAKPFVKETLAKWTPVDAYIGGAEHAVLHLLYARFVAMVLYDLEYLKYEEPFPFLFSHGLIIKDGSKMSKSKGNVIVPDKYIEKYGADSLRCYLMFMGSFDSGGDFRDTGMIGMYKFLKRVWGLFLDEGKVGEKSSENLEKVLHKTIRKVGEDMPNFKFNTAIASMMEFVNEWKKEKMVLAKSDSLSFLKLLAPLAPYMCEELYQGLVDDDKKGSVHKASWPEFSEKLVKEDVVEIVVQVNGKLRDSVSLGAMEAKDEEKVMEKVWQSERVGKWVNKETLKKKVFVPGRLVNLVV
jgi:leucyl-tRNA synthetase